MAYSREVREEAVRLCREGLSERKVAAAVGCRVETIAKWAADARRPAGSFDPLADAERFGHELTPAENRARLNLLRSGETKHHGVKGQVIGEAYNAGQGRARRQSGGARRLLGDR